MSKLLIGDAETLGRVREFTLTTPSKGYLKAEVSTGIDVVTELGPTEVKVHATEFTRLYFAHGDTTAPQYEAYRLRHEFRFVLVDTAWTLASAMPQLQAGPPPPPYATAVPVRSSAENAPDVAAGGVKPSRVVTANSVNAKGQPPIAGDTTFGKSQLSAPPLSYDYGAMYRYAEAHVYNYNPAYRAFANDCTNFISQIMKAGGWANESGFYWSDSAWWYNSINQTHTWAGAHNWGVFAQITSGRTTHIPQVYQMLTTDVLQVDWDHPGDPGVGDEPANNIDHTMIVTGTLGNTGAAEEVYLTYHTSDRWNVAFWGWLKPQTEARDVWYAHRT